MIAGLLLVGVSAASAETLRDPTQPPDAGSALADLLAAELPPPRVSSILISANRRHAVIDGDRVQVGDLLPEGEVVAIEPTEVRLDGPEGPFRLPLYRVPVLKRTPGED